jgi:hypothetical protein
MSFTVGEGSFPPPILSAPAQAAGCINTVSWMEPAVMVFPGAGAQDSGQSSLAADPGMPTASEVASGSPASQPQPASETIISEGFEGLFPPASWSVSSGVSWGTTTYTSHSGTQSVWCAGSAGAPGGGYPTNLNAWLVYGPFTLADATSASLTFWYRNQSLSGADKFSWMASRDGMYFSGYQVSGDENSWRSATLDLSNVPSYGNLCGQPQVWIAFIFTSGSANSGLSGAYVDDVAVVKQTARPDLQVAETSWPPAVVEGAATTVQQRITNVGIALANASHAKLFLSTDGDMNPYNDWLAGEVPVPALAPGASAWVQWQFTMPNLGTGQYDVWALGMVDSQNEILESNENNLFLSSTNCPVSDQPVLFEIQCSADTSFSSLQDSGWVGDTQWTFGNLQAGQAYYYRVRAQRGAEESAWSLVTTSQQSPLVQGPVVTAPSGISAAKQTAQDLSGVQLSDPDAGNAPLTLHLTAVHGALTVNTQLSSGLDSAQVTGNGTANVSVTASIATLRSVLSNSQGVSYTGGLNFVGTDTLALALSDNGNNCQGSPLSNVASIPVTVSGTAYDAWLVGAFAASEWQDPTQEATMWGQTADPDSDGLSNLVEYALGLDPNRGSDGNGTTLDQMTMAGDSAHLTLTFKRRKDDPSLQYTVEVSGDGQIWSSGPGSVAELSATPLDNTFDRVICQDLTPIAAGGARFARLKITKTN